MKVLFFLRHHGYIRNFESTFRLLADRGHRVHVVVDVIRPMPLADRLVADCPRFSYEFMHLRRDGQWVGISRDVRNAGDYLRYLHPRYQHGHRLRGRVEKQAPKSFRRVLTIRGLDKAPSRRVIVDVIRLLEQAIPSDPAIEDFITSHAPDVVLVTPLVEVESPQQDYLRAARALGIPTGLCVHSWDNLTNKGMMWEMPDRVFVWNHVQRREAIQLHRVPARSVVVTGAQSYDHWFEKWPSLSREEFARRVGLDPSNPFVLYVCSSAFITPEERPFVERWIAHIRASARPELCEVGILVRPHAGHARQWNGFDASGYTNTSVWPTLGASPIDEQSKEDYFHSLHYSAAVVGINTSAMIEAGILARPVHTILAPEFAQGQGGTVHFQYLVGVGGGLLHAARDFDDHLDKLSVDVSNPSARCDRSLGFVRSFVRPFGLGDPGTPRLVAGIEDLGRAEPSIPARTAPWTLLVRWLFRRGLLVGSDAPFNRAVRGAWGLRRIAKRTRRRARRRIQVLVRKSLAVSSRIDRRSRALTRSAVVAGRRDAAVVSYGR